MSSRVYRTSAPTFCAAVSWLKGIADRGVVGVAGSALNGARICAEGDDSTPEAASAPVPECRSCDTTARLGLRPSEGDND